MTVQSRPMQSDDYRRMRALVIETVPITPIGFNWDMRRLDGKRFYNEDLTDNRVSRRPVQLWENEAGELVGYVLSESSGDAHLQVHPDFRHIEMSYGGMCRHVRLGAQPIPTPVVPAGYTLRTTDSDDMADCQRIADLLNAAFNRNFHNALEFHHFAKVDTGDAVAANAFYTSMGFTEAYRGYIWRKVW